MIHIRAKRDDQQTLCGWWIQVYKMVVQVAPPAAAHLVSEVRDPVSRETQTTWIDC